jgi:RND family efflux transporter MFP subunit
MMRLKRGGALVAFGVAAWLLSGCSPATTLAPTEPPVVTVSQPLERDDIIDYDQYTGRLDAAETVEVRARVRGELIKVHFKDGALVNAGDPLYDLDPRTYKAALSIAEAKKANAQAGLKLAETEFERESQLFQTKSAAARDVDVWASRKGIALAEVQQAEAEIERARLDVGFTQIKAPISGRISRSLVTKGNLVNAGGGDTLLTTIVSVDPIYAYFDVDERSLALFRERRAKEVGGDDKTKQPVIPVFMGLITDGDRFPRQGTLDFADNRINPSTGTNRVRGVFPNKDGLLTPNQFVRVRVPVGEKYPGLLVSDKAIGTDQGKKYLLIVNNEDKVEYRPVVPGRLDGDLRIFKLGAGLKPGEWVIVNGVQRVRPGIQVKPEHVAMPTRPSAADKTEAETKSKP